jgi:acyl-CoA synthetase (AMP-forming)/AMP-acid ligase II
MHGPSAITPLGELLVSSAARAPDSASLVFPDQRVTTAELLARAREVARGLHATGVRRGDRVAVLMPNCVEFVEALFGGALLGATVLLINGRYRHSELAYVLGDAGASAVITTDRASDNVDFIELLQSALPAGREGGMHAVVLGERAPDGFIDERSFQERASGVLDEVIDDAAASVEIGDVAIMMYTSGTTAAPKGCLLSHRSVVGTAAAIVERYGLGAGDVWWCPLPLFHMSGVLPLCATFLADSRLACMTTFDAGVAVQQMEHERVTVQFGIFPTVNQELLAHPDFAGSDRSAIRLVNAQPGPPRLTTALREAYRDALIVNAYGCTELGGIVSLTDPSDQTWPATSGTPWPGMQVGIVDRVTGRELPRGETGEIVARGWGMFEGYHGAPELTARAVDEEGWFHTGDVGTMDARGRVTFHGRYKDMLKVGGENVAASELESFLAMHPAVLLAQVVGIPDAKLVEVPAAFVELAPGAVASEAELMEFCRGNIASFKIPRHVRFVDRWPMSATKIQKFKLRSALMRELRITDSV